MANEKSDVYDMAEMRQYLQAHTGGKVVLDKDESSGIASVIIQQPSKLNAMTGKMMVDLSDIIDELEHWQEGKAVLLRGAGGNFCSGGDLQFLNRIMNRTGGAIMCQFMQTTLTRLLQLPLISVALVEGQALGGGAELTTACDYRLITPDTRIGFVHGRLGITPGWGGGCRLVSLVGRRAALEMLSSARPWHSEEIMSIRLADDVISAKDAVGETKAWISHRIRSKPAAVQAAKRLVAKASQTDVDARVVERLIFCRLWASDEHKTTMLKGIKHK